MIGRESLGVLHTLTAEDGARMTEQQVLRISHLCHRFIYGISTQKFELRAVVVRPRRY